MSILHPCKRRSSSVAPLIPHLTGSKRTPFFHPSPRTHPSTSRADATGHQNLSLSTAPGISVSQAPQPDPPLQGALAAPCRSVPPNEQCPGSVCRADGRSEGLPRLPKPDWQPAPSLCDHRWGGNRLWVFTRQRHHINAGKEKKTTTVQPVIQDANHYAKAAGVIPPEA
ncbi:hypothetical protein ACOMHN_042077 [Nucella lapillus]